MLRILVLTRDAQGGHDDGQAAWIQRLRANRDVRVTVTESAERLRALEGFDAIAATGDVAAPDEVELAALALFVERGGGLVVAGDAVDAWLMNPRAQALLGLGGGHRTPLTELVAHTQQHDITRRLDRSITVVGTCLLPAEPPDAREIVLKTNWHYTAVPVAYTREAGAGRVFVSTLSIPDGMPASATHDRLLYRALRYVSGRSESAPVRVALIGYGAIGFEHGEAIRGTDGLELALVCDRSHARVDMARQSFDGVRATDDIANVERDDDIDLAIIGTPPNTHASLAERLLRAGKHVVVEKPFCMTTAEADRLISLAREGGRVLTVYQNRRWDPDFLAIQRVVTEGTIGEVFHVETFVGGYSHPCDLWHSHEPVSGGVFYDWGSHYLDWVLTLMPGEVSDVRASSHKRVWHDVTNADQAAVYVRFTDGREASFIHSDVAALLKPKWYILGTRGAIVANWRHTAVTSRKWSGDLIEERLAPSEALPVVTVAERDAAGLLHERVLSLPPAPVHPFHVNLADHLLLGEPLAVEPRSSRRNIAVMEAAAFSAAHDAEVVPIAEEYA